MLTLTAEQLAILSLPDPHEFSDELAREIRQDFPQQVVDLDAVALPREVERSYAYGCEVLKITRMPTLVAWVRADVAWARGLRDEAALDLRIRIADDPNLVAQDILAGLLAGAGWPTDRGA